VGCATGAGLGVPDGSGVPGRNPAGDLALSARWELNPHAILPVGHLPANPTISPVSCFGL
ncbi:MAG: hypothetical protein NZ482_10180, partial [Gloeomargarita sp. SKYG98]|nr:hypothetical protein [Gloeomargarita sp. SKYG98]